MLVAVRMLWIWGNNLKAEPRHIRTSNYTSPCSLTIRPIFCWIFLKAQYFDIQKMNDETPDRYEQTEQQITMFCCPSISV